MISHNEFIWYFINIYTSVLCFICVRLQLCSISNLIFPDAWIALSSTYKSARQWFRERGSSLKNNKNNVGPRIEPWCMPDNSYKNSDIPSSLFID